VRIQNAAYEVFRRSWLTLASEWSLAFGVSLTVIWSYRQLGLQGEEWEGLSLAVPPVIWAACRTLQWAYCTWTATADGRLIVREGVLARTRQVIHLCSVRDVESKAPHLARWLGIGHLTFRATDLQGQLRPFRWIWLGRYSRLCEILQARGQLPVGRPSWWQLVSGAVERLAHAVGMWLAQGWALTAEIVARLQGRWFVEDYGRFLAFCHHLLRSAGRERWAPSWAPSAVVRRWMAVLRRARIVVDAPNDIGWRMAGTVRSIGDVCCRIGEEDLRRAV
jgi:membrane protein YdbS with pleckstrin-like domain